tara:strand:- start:29 stop:367 length:339 start_codon:yes stop_codon:yes gene_type:complete
MKYPISIGESIFFLGNYTLMRFYKTSYGQIGPKLFIPLVFICSANTSWHLALYNPLFNNKIISIIIYFILSFIYNFYGIFIFIADNSDKFPNTEIITGCFILGSIGVEMMLN